MYPAEFAYVRPTGLDGVFAAIERYADDVKVVAGGQSLLPMMKLRLATPGVLVDLAGAGELRGQWSTTDGVRVGAMTTYRELQRSPRTLDLLPGLEETLALIADPQVRARGTIGGAVAHGDPTADLPAMLLALEAVVLLASPRGIRRRPLDEFFTGVYSTDLAEDEVVLAIDIPQPPPGTGAAYQKYEQPASHLALCGVAAALTIGGGRVHRARLAMTGVAATPRRLTALEEALTGTQVNAKAFDEIAVTAVHGVEPLDDMHASAAYRLQLLKLATREALQIAASRAGAGWAA
ncbi:xanthine dehydrogenase family protein subunit M [Nonomuraea sp. NPDC049649]|uniref:FAD binding domain-containing protein n=1 Tax=Nonomuraea sp. NPDC049649 TaxID=3155776 RepID=UPI003425419F